MFNSDLKRKVSYLELDIEFQNKDLRELRSQFEKLLNHLEIELKLVPTHYEYVKKEDE